MPRLIYAAALLTATSLWLGCGADEPAGSQAEEAGANGSSAGGLAPPPPPPAPSPPTAPVSLEPPASSFRPDDPLMSLGAAQVCEEILKVRDAIADVRATVNDLASARRAAGEEHVLQLRRRRLEDRLEELKAKMTPQEVDRLEQKHEPQFKQRLSRLGKELTRMQAMRAVYDAFYGAAEE